MLRILTNVTSGNLTNTNKTSTDTDTPSPSMTWYTILTLVILVMLSAYSNGMNIGIMGLDV
jgi:hypothetical protein